MMRKKVDIVHIYAGTSGSAGLYIDEIFDSLNKDFSQQIIVNYYFPFNYGKKIFYKYSELSSPYLKFIRQSRLRHFIRLLELLFSLSYSYFYLLFRKNQLLNYNLTSDLKFEYFFLLVLKKIHKKKIAITCHDVLPFKSAFIKSNKQIKRKQSFFKLADILIIHNKNSYKDLINNFDVDIKHQKIVEIPFPIMDLKKLNLHSESIKIPEKKQFRVGMIGHLRIEKGVNILIDAWDIFYNSSINAELLIAGNLPIGENYNFEKIKNKNLILIDKFINDFEYQSIIKSCDVIILPYIRGTNSGIPSSILSLNKILIASDIEMFLNNPLIYKEFLFKNGEPKQLSDKIQWIFNMSEIEREKIIHTNQDILKEYKKIYKLQVVRGFSSIF